MPEATIDINSDLGEFVEALESGADFELMRYITSANVACGGHAGDVTTMTKTLAEARKLNVAVGAHPSYPDRANFGRIESPLSPAEVEDTVHEQIASLMEVAKQAGVRVIHVKPHGALYHAANQKRDIAVALGRAVLALDPRMIMVGQAGAAPLAIWRDMGLQCAAEAFADRAYEADGTLRKRSVPGALHDVEHAAAQALDIALRHTVVAGNGTKLTVPAGTICIHSDTPGAATIAREVNRRLKAAGVRVQAL